MAAGDPGTPLGNRQTRAQANDARYGPAKSFDPLDQGGFGAEDMIAERVVGGPSVPVQDEIAPPPDLSVLGDGGQTFGGA